MTHRDANLLHPAAREKFGNLLVELHQAYHLNKVTVYFKMFETYRTPVRQQRLYEQGRSEPGKVVTNARAWESAHQYGLAADFVPYLEPDIARGRGLKPGWNWELATESDWAYLSSAATRNGLRSPLPWDRPHVEDYMWTAFKEIIDWRTGKKLQPT